MKKLLLLNIFSYLLITGCADKGGKLLDDNCRYEVISDYNNVVLSCTYLGSYNWAEKKASCKSKAQSFLKKYPNINCKAEKPSDTSVDPDIITITGREIENLIDELEQEFLE